MEHERCLPHSLVLSGEGELVSVQRRTEKIQFQALEWREGKKNKIIHKHSQGRCIIKHTNMYQYI